MSLLAALSGVVFFSLSGALVGVAVLICALWIMGFLNIYSIFVLAAAPIAALFAVGALEHALRGNKFRVGFGSLREAILLLVLVALLESSRSYDFIGRAMALNQSTDMVSKTSVILSSLGGAISVGCIVVIVCLLLVGVLELLTRWVFKVFDTRPWVPFDALRPILVVFIIGLGAHLLGDFFSSELSPNAILKQAVSSSKGQ